MDELRGSGINLWAALMMYYRPWVVQAFRAEGYPFQTSTYYDRLHRGHTEVANAMNAVRAARIALLQQSGCASSAIGI